MSVLSGEAELTVGDIVIDMNNKEAFVNGSSMNLTPHEYKLLEVLATYEDHIVSRKHIFASVWGHKKIKQEQNCINIFISKLRNKMEACHVQRVLIETICKRGYCLRELGAPAPFSMTRKRRYA